MKIDGAANVMWERTVDVSDEDLSQSIAAMPNGGFVLQESPTTGTMRSPRYTNLVRTDENGTPLWEQSFIFENRIYGNAVVSCSDGGIAVTGRVYLPESGYDAFVMKVDANGVLNEE